MISALINGREVELPAAQSVSDYLQTLGVNPRAVAVELNGEILERSAYAGSLIEEGAVVEIVRMVGGGAEPEGLERSAGTPRAESSPRGRGGAQ